jgi:hypothetical protein
LPCVFRKTHGKVTKTNSSNSAFAVRFWPWRMAKSLLCRAFFPGARQRASHAVSSWRRRLLFFAVRHGKTHGKDYLPCVVRRGARQRVFTVQNATVRPLPCAPMKNARQRVCRAFLGLCRAPVAHGKAAVSCSDVSSCIVSLVITCAHMWRCLGFEHPMR